MYTSYMMHRYVSGIGRDNVVLGEDAGARLTTGEDNILVGQSAGQFLETGSHNVILGGFTANGEPGLTGAVVVSNGDGVVCARWDARGDLSTEPEEGRAPPDTEAHRNTTFDPVDNVLVDRVRWNGKTFRFLSATRETVSALGVTAEDSRHLGGLPAKQYVRQEDLYNPIVQTLTITGPGSIIPPLPRAAPPPPPEAATTTSVVRAADVLATFGGLVVDPQVTLEAVTRRARMPFPVSVVRVNGDGGVMHCQLLGGGQALEVVFQVFISGGGGDAAVVDLGTMDVELCSFTRRVPYTGTVRLAAVGVGRPVCTPPVEWSGGTTRLDVSDGFEAGADVVTVSLLRRPSTTTTSCDDDDDLCVLGIHFRWFEKKQ